MCFSGDKLLGGPQAGVIAGEAVWIGRLTAHPLYRALRLDKVALALLQETVDLHLSDAGAVPLQAMLHAPVAALQARVAAIVRRLPSVLQAAPAGCTSRLGGGTLPTATLQFHRHRHPLARRQRGWVCRRAAPGATPPGDRPHPPRPDGA